VSIHYNETIYRQSQWAFSFEGEYRIYSEALERSAAALNDAKAVIESGELIIKEGLVWSSWLMGIHELLVFVGLCGLGESALGFRFGLPLATDATIIRTQLIAMRHELELTADQVTEIYREDLRRAGMPWPALCAWCSSWFMPRDGWHKHT
jgi:hypothetical protein